MGKKIIRGSDNVFADIGLQDAGIHRLKADIALKIINTINKNGLTQSSAAALIGATQADVSNLSRGQLKGFTLDRLLGFLKGLDMDIQVRIRHVKTKGQSPFKKTNTDNHIHA